LQGREILCGVQSLTIAKINVVVGRRLLYTTTRGLNKTKYVRERYVENRERGDETDASRKTKITYVGVRRMDKM
jgi:hypothetical protein